MSRKKGLMSEQMKEALAEDLGFADKVDNAGWSSITAGEAGGMVKRAVELAEKQMVNEEMRIPKPETGMANRAPRSANRGK